LLGFITVVNGAEKWLKLRRHGKNENQREGNWGDDSKSSKRERDNGWIPRTPEVHQWHGLEERRMERKRAMRNTFASKD